MSNALTNKKTGKDKEDLYNRIQQFVNGEPVVMTADDENILKRWNFAHTQMLTRKYTEDQVAANIAEQFNVSIYTARNDYYAAMNLFAGVIKVSKKFLLHRHAENILMKIQTYSESPKLIKFVPKLMDSYTKAVMAIPDDNIKERPASPIITFNIQNGQSMPALPAFEEALARLTAVDTSVIAETETPENYDE
ncbi:hypothetical protein ACTJIJ_19820 [Niabella sp. 22666]|uniref:hypothetical protein n=1 Tax=Niabella sp. 22666 TaxID=3453954 RepID=UPI003F8478B6